MSTPGQTRQRPDARPRTAAGLWCAAWSGRSGTLAADQLPVPLRGQLAAVVNEEAASTAELVGLHRQHLDGELFVGQVSAGELEALRHLDLVDVDCAGL